MEAEIYLYGPTNDSDRKGRGADLVMCGKIVSFAIF